MELTYAEMSVAGPCPTNQDSVGFWQAPALPDGRAGDAMALLADGVGSLGSGDIASRLAIEAGINTFRAARDGESGPQRMLELVNAANWAVYDKGFEQDGPGRIATTLAAAVFSGDEIHVGTVGDSRVYLVHRGMIKLLSVDHSLVGMQRRFGIITEEEEQRSEYRHIITRGLGVDPQVRVDIERAPALVGDRVVLCSDGLHGYVSEREIAHLVQHISPVDACRHLVGLAVQRGTHDNTSLQIISIDSL